MVKMLIQSLKLAELGQIILNFVSVVPNGMVVFFPSYAFLNAVKEVWESSGMMIKFSIKKKVSSHSESIKMDN
jgi:chromosome transmission fidelity protein 1